MKLIIAEKPSLAKNIAKAIGIVKEHKDNGYIDCKNDYTVTYCYGHLLQLKSPNAIEKYNKKWNEIEYPIIPNKFEYIPKKDEGVIKQLKNIGNLLKKASLVINCGDADREGQIIIDNVLDYFNNKVPVKRLWLPEQTENTIRKELNNLKDNKEYYHLNQEGQARTIIDWLYGMNFTSYLTVIGKELYNSGRVITPIVKYIYDRNLEIKNFISKTYYSLESEEEVNGDILKLILKNKYDDENEAINYANQLNKLKAKVTSISTKDVEKTPKKLFSLSTLQSELSKKYKIPFKKSLELIQQLYEEGYLTYPRTNTEYLSSNEKEKIKGIINILNTDNTLEFKETKRIFDDSKIESHSAITITSKIAKNLSDDKLKVYQTVLNRFLSNFCKEKCIISETSLVINIGEEEIKLIGKSIKQKGYTMYEKLELSDKIPNLEVNQEFNVNFKPIEKKTTPPNKVTEIELSRFLKNPFKKEEKEENDDKDYIDILNGVEIGTEATRTGIIEKCVNIGYLDYDSKKSNYDITVLGEKYIKLMLDKGIDLFKEKTVETSKLQKEVYKGTKTLEEVIRRCVEEIGKITILSEEDRKVVYAKKELKDGEVEEIKGKNGVTYFKGKYKGGERIIPKEMKYYNHIVKLTKSNAQKLFNGDSIEVKLEFKGKLYNQKLQLVENGQWLNLDKK